MSTVELFGYMVEVDEEKTKEWYTGSSAWGCECGDCRNFLALAGKKDLPVSVVDTLDNLGIPPQKATYVCEMYPDGEGHRYRFSYRIAGNILCEKEELAEGKGQVEGRCCHEPYPYGAPDFPEPHFDLEFWVTLPWVLEEQPE